MNDPATIEREIEAERDGLRRSLQALDARLSPEHIMENAKAMLQTHGGDAADVALRAARENPFAVGLIGAGVAWLIADAVREPSTDVSNRSRDPDLRVTGTSPVLDEPATAEAGFDARVAAADRAIKQAPRTGEYDMHTTSYTDGTLNRDTRYDHDDSKRARMKQSAKSLRDRIGEGLDNMPDSARSRILSARLAAIDAQASVEARLRRTSSSARRSVQDNPLIVGALALAVGAAIGASLPRSATEDRYLGSKRDDLFDEAERIFRDEASKLREVAKAAVAETKSAIKDTLRDGPPTEDNPIARVSTAARSEARKQNLGGVG